MVRNRTFSDTGWDYGDWFEGDYWQEGNYSNKILNHTITEINESWDYYFNVSDNSIFCQKDRSDPLGAPYNYYWIEIPYKKYTTDIFDWNFVNDTYIDDILVNTNYGKNSTINVEKEYLYGLIKFNLSFIPETATIESANLSLYLNSTSANKQNIEFYRVLQDWNEDNVTYNNWYSTSNYSSSPNITGEIKSAYVDRYYNWSAFIDVEYFHNHRNENYGWLIKVTDNNRLAELDSKDATNASRRPILYVTYSEGNTYVHPDY